ncbi:MAG: hypothetical protein ACFFCW_14635 [Candidatus Hodarchaeota archaeon]
MSKTEEQNKKRTGQEEHLPPASFSSSVTVVVHRIGGSLKTF